MGTIKKSGVDYGGSGSGDVTKQYVDTQDAATLQNAKNYTDTKSQEAVTNEIYDSEGCVNIKSEVPSGVFIGENISTYFHPSEDNIMVGSISEDPEENRNGTISIGLRNGVPLSNTIAIGNDITIAASGVANLGGVAIGHGAEFGPEDTVSFGSSTSKRRLINIEDGVVSSDAATVGQLNTSIFPSYDTLGTKEIVIASGNVEWVGDSRYTAPVLSIGNGTVISAPVGTETNPTSAGAIAMMGGKAEGHHSIAIYGEAKGGLAVGDMSKAGQLSVAIGHQTKASNNQQLDGSVALGFGATTTKLSSVALGASASVTRVGEVNVGTIAPAAFPGYNNTKYRVIGGVHDGVNNHDAATVAQGNKLMTSAPTATDEGVLGQLWTDTTAMHTYQCTAIDTTDPQNPVYTWTQRW